MQLATILDTPGIYIGYDAKNQWLYTDWKGEHTSESSKECCLLMLASLRARPCHKILNDNTNITHTTVQLSEWSTWWLNEMLAAGLQYLAWILPLDFPRRQATETLLLAIPQPAVATFDDLASAYIWLQNQPVKPL